MNGRVKGEMKKKFFKGDQKREWKSRYKRGKKRIETGERRKKEREVKKGNK